jgi:putative transposase
MGDHERGGLGVALLREAVIRPLAEHSRLSSESVAEAADQLGLSRTILYKLLQRYRRRPQTSSLLPWKRGRKPSESLLGEEREALLNTCIDEFYLQPVFAFVGDPKRCLNHARTVEE